MNDVVGRATLLTGIGELVTFDPSHEGPAGVVHNAALLEVDGIVVWTGSAAAAPAEDADEIVDLGGAAVIPGFVDSHTHLAFAGDRTAEFEARMAGQPYAAGGIRSTVRATRAATDDQLRRHLARYVAELRSQGTTTFEIKSGYGLTVRDEQRLLKLASEFTSETTFMGAHVVAPEYADDPDAYVELVVGDMLDACAPHARWIDVFCERGAFDVDQSRRILDAGAARGLGVRMHAGQLGPGNGVALAVELGAASIDHATYVTDSDVELLGEGSTVVTLLPGAEFSTRQPYPDARRLLDAGAQIALSTDCNPGSSFTSSMPFCIAIAVRDMKMSPVEAIRAATVGGARALRRDDVGHLRAGARADLAVLEAPSFVHLAYRPGVPLVSATRTQGSFVHAGA